MLRSTLGLCVNPYSLRHKLSFAVLFITFVRIFNRFLNEANTCQKSQFTAHQNKLECYISTKSFIHALKLYIYTVYSQERYTKKKWNASFGTTGFHHCDLGALWNDSCVVAWISSQKTAFAFIVTLKLYYLKYFFEFC